MKVISENDALDTKPFDLGLIKQTDHILINPALKRMILEPTFSNVQSLLTTDCKILLTLIKRVVSTSIVVRLMVTIASKKKVLK